MAHARAPWLARAPAAGFLAQVLALFSHFDSDCSGTIAYDEFAKFAMLPNPKGGTAVYPKPITMTRERHQFHQTLM